MRWGTRFFALGTDFAPLRSDRAGSGTDGARWGNGSFPSGTDRLRLGTGGMGEGTEFRSAKGHFHSKDR